MYIKLIKPHKFLTELQPGKVVQVSLEKGNELIMLAKAVKCDRYGKEILSADEISERIKKRVKKNKTK